MNRNNVYLFYFILFIIMVCVENGCKNLPSRCMILYDGDHDKINKVRFTLEVIQFCNHFKYT